MRPFPLGLCTVLLPVMTILEFCVFVLQHVQGLPNIASIDATIGSIFLTTFLIGKIKLCGKSGMDVQFTNRRFLT